MKNNRGASGGGWGGCPTVVSGEIWERKKEKERATFFVLDNFMIRERKGEDPVYPSNPLRVFVL